jgi:FMN reductase
MLMTSQIRKPRVVAFTGSTRRPSKSRALAEAIGASVRGQLDADIATFDVVDAGPGLGAAFTRHQLTPEAAAIVDAIEQADAVIAVSPVYKGSYTGLFKHLFDFVDQNALANKPVVVGATGGGHRHALIVEHQLRPLFGFFSALVVPTAVYASDHEFLDGRVVEPTVLERIEQAGTQLALLLGAQLRVTHAHPELPVAHPERLERPEPRRAVAS